MLRFLTPGFLDPALSMSWGLTQKAYDHLPVVTPADLSNRWERYRLLLGSWTVEGSHIHVLVEAIVEIEDPDCYVEGRERVWMNIHQCREKVEKVLTLPDYHHLAFVGEFHTHPVWHHEIERFSWEPSDGDQLTAIVRRYQREIPATQPFLFLIGGLLDSGRTGYECYRACQEGEDYWIESVPSAV